MLDIREIREDRDGIEAQLRTRDPSIDLGEIVSLDEERRRLIAEVEAFYRTHDDYEEMAKNAFKGFSAGAGGGGGQQIPTLTHNPLGAVGQAGSQFFQSLYGGGGGGRGGLF